MEIFAGLSVGLLMLGALFIAIKTLLLWRRSRELPELLLSMMLSMSTVIGYPLAILCSQVPAPAMLPVHILYPLVMNGGFACLLLFTLRVFRPNAVWARFFAALTMSMLAASAVIYIAEALGDDPRGPAEMIGLSLFNSTGIGITYLWTTVESISCYRRLKLQLRLGLADPVVVNRVLLWGLMTLAAGSAVVGSCISMLTGSFMSPMMVGCSSVMGIIHAGCLYFAFHPPRWYRAWVTQNAAGEEARG